MNAAGGRSKLQSKLWRPFHRSDFGYHSDLLRKQLWIWGVFRHNSRKISKTKAILVLIYLVSHKSGPP